MRVSSDVKFAVVPEWVVFADVSANAVRLYAVLCRFADDKTNEAWPARRTIAEKMHVSRDTVDRATRELEGIGALTITNRSSLSGDADTNLYRLHALPNLRQGGRKGAGTGGRKGAGTGGRKGAAQNESLLNENHLNDAQAADEPPAPPADWGEVEDAKTFLVSLNGSVPDGFPIEQLDDPKLWARLDNEVFTSGFEIDLFAALTRYLRWWGSKSKSRRHRNVARGFGNWVGEDIDRARSRKESAEARRRAR